MYSMYFKLIIHTAQNRRNIFCTIEPTGIDSIAQNYFGGLIFGYNLKMSIYEPNNYGVRIMILLAGEY